MLQLSTGINTQLIHSASQLVSHLTGTHIQPNTAIVGHKAFSYTSGMYQDGVLRGRSDSEVLDPTAIGILEAENRVPLLTGREGLRRRLRELGYGLSEDEFSEYIAGSATWRKRNPTSRFATSRELSAARRPFLCKRLTSWRGSGDLWYFGRSGGSRADTGARW